MSEAPRLAAWLAGLRVARGEREFALGDLAEDYAAICRIRGRAAARRWYWRQALRSALARPHDSGLFMRNFVTEVRTALRQVLRAPATSAAAVLTYALGIGANVAIFSVAWPVLAAPLPFPNEGQLTAIWLTYETEKGTIQRNPLSVGDYNDIRTASAFSGTAAYSNRLSQMNLTSDREPRQIAVAHVTPSFFGVMGVAPVAGRVLQPSDEEGDGLLLVLGERAWRSMFGGDPSVIGRIVRLDGEPVQIVGVAPSTTGLGTIEADGWSVLRLPAGRERQRAYYIQAVGRLAPGVSRQTANAELDAIMTRAAADFPASNKHLRARADDFREQITGPVSRPLLVLGGGAALLLLVAGINLAGLLVARNVQRARETGIRRALGASRLRLWTQFASESLVLSTAGGLLGLAVAIMTLRAVIGLAPEGAWHPDRALSLPIVLLFTLGLALVMGLAVAALPAWKAASNAQPMLSEARGSSGSRAAVRARSAIIAAQVAVTVLLLVVAALVGTSLARVLSIDPGFRVENGLVADIKLPEGRYDSAAARARFFDALVERAAALPGVNGACAINQMPLEWAPGSMTWVAEGTTAMRSSSQKSVSDGCFAVLGIPLVRGRLLRSHEPEPVVVLSQSMARLLWPDGRDPIGERVHMGLPDGPLMTVAGIVGDIRNDSLERGPGRQVWLPHGSGYWPPNRLLVNGTVPAAGLAMPLRSVLRELDNELALANVRTMDEIVGKATAPRRFVLWLLGGFAVIALLLSALGIYGLLSNVVGQRVREIGIRRALGAGTAHITRIVAGTVGSAILTGAAAGLVAARAASATVASLLYEMSATDVRIYATVAVFVTVIAALASWPPARRAIRVEPLRALKD